MSLDQESSAFLRKPSSSMKLKFSFKMNKVNSFSPIEEQTILKLFCDDEG